MFELPPTLLNQLITIPGHPYGKKNSAVGGGSGQYYTTKAYKQWANRAGVALGKYGHVLPIDYAINLQCRFYLGTDREVDLDNLYSGIQDVLVKAGVLLDDHYKIVASHNCSGVAVDKLNPRTEVLITALDNTDLPNAII